MTTFLRTFWQTLTGRSAPAAASPPTPAPRPPPAVAQLNLDIAPNDPLAIFFQGSPGAVDVDSLNMESPGLQALKAAGVKVAMPLVSQGVVIGVLTLGARRSEQEYTADDRGLLSNLATQAAPAVRVAQLVRQQKIEALERERFEQELRVARLIQQTLLPQELPKPEGWEIAAYYQPARAVGGDFYDFIKLPNGRLGIVIGDVTDKGVPAALLMATTRAHLRSAALHLDTPGQVLAHVNDVLYPDIPDKMFVTCLYAILDSSTGRLHFANAGHDMAYCWTAGHVVELRARGMPLGLLPEMVYEEKETMIASGQSVLFYSDGLVEAHSPAREMFGFPRLGQLLGEHPGGRSAIDFLLGHLKAFTGPEWEQEDDTTMVILQRTSTPLRLSPDAKHQAKGDGSGGEAWQTLTTFTIASQPGNEREAMKRVAEAVKDILPADRIEKLKTAVAEGAMNAIEHGNQNQADLPVEFAVLVTAAHDAVAVRITDRGAGKPIPASTAPDIDLKLAGLQSPRGWGLFLIEKMVDKLNIIADDSHHTLELIMGLTEGARNE